MTTRQFKKQIWAYYTEHRRSFAWRETHDPYKIMVSEIMLQQTQTDRVATKYDEWLTLFPTTAALAQAPLQKVLMAWKGLGYNRRALALKRTAEKIQTDYAGTFPQTYEQILDLPGIGPYTAGALMAFAYNKAVPIIETNIRTVYIHFFFKDHGNIHDKEIMKLVEETLDTENPREWYYALMDYGVMLKKTIGNANRRSTHYTKQTAFKGSNRQVRAALLHAITEHSSTEAALLQKLLNQDIKATKTQVEKNIAALIKEGFIVKKQNYFHITPV